MTQASASFINSSFTHLILQYLWSERNQTQRTLLCDSIYMRFNKRQNQGMVTEMWVVTASGKEGSEGMKEFEGRMKIFYLDPSDSSSLCIFANIYQTIHFRNLLNYIPIKFIWKYFLVCAGLGNLNWSLKVLSHLLPDIKVQPTLCCLHAGSGKQTDPSVWLYQCLPGIPGRVLMIQCHNSVEKV